MSDTSDQERTRKDHTTSTEPDARPSPKPFRFKSKPSYPSAHDTRSSRPSYRPSSSQSRHHRRKKRRLSPPSYDDTTHPDIAFRESLFDAMGDDEGAIYWETIYGQPIHTYPDQKRNEETGELEKMGEEEYIAFVRRGMWERSREGVEAERVKRLQERKEQEKEKEKRGSGGPGDTAVPGSADGGTRFEREMDESLRRGRKRKERKQWRERRDAYVRAWVELNELANGAKTADEVVYLRNRIHWPVESGKRKDVGFREVERFMVKTAEAVVDSTDSDKVLRLLLSNLKLERVRWHPDKVQHRFSSLNIDEGTLAGVTEVFQAMDRLYSERRG